MEEGIRTRMGERNEKGIEEAVVTQARMVRENVIGVET